MEKYLISHFSFFTGLKNTEVPSQLNLIRALFHFRKSKERGTKDPKFYFSFFFFLSSFLAAKQDFTLVLERLIENSVKLPGLYKNKNCKSCLIGTCGVVLYHSYWWSLYYGEDVILFVTTNTRKNSRFFEFDLYLRVGF